MKVLLLRYDTDPFVPVTPGVKRAVRQAADLLRGDGHTVVPFTISKLERLHKIYFDHMMSENGNKVTSITSNPVKIQ